MLGNAVVTTAYMTALRVHTGSISVFILYEVMVKDFTVILGITVVGRVTTNFTTAHSVGLHRIGVFEPVDDVKVVNMLLGDVITAKPIEVIPIDGMIAFIGSFFEIIKNQGLVGLSQKLLSNPEKYLKFDGEVIIIASIFSLSKFSCILDTRLANSSFGKSFIN